MSIRVAVTHSTTYSYDRRVTLGPQVIRLKPASHSVTKLLNYTMRVSPRGQFIHWQQDPFGNHLARVVFPEKTDFFSVDVEFSADLIPFNPFDFFLEPEVDTYPLVYSSRALDELAPYKVTSPIGDVADALVADYRKKTGLRTVDFLVAVNEEIQSRIDYVVRMEPGIQPPEETMGLGSGSCRDSAWLLVQVLRHLGMAARFASGYLVQLVHDVEPNEGPRGPDKDFTDLHAWAEVFLPGAGWIGLDPTSGLFAGEGHIPVCCTPDPSSAAPISGGLGECEVEFSHEMSVVRIEEIPRVTKPIDDHQWKEILHLGNRVDQDLVANDVRVTMGGEPTYVAIKDTDDDQWNTEALGDEKLRRAHDLFARLNREFAPGGLPHFGQGKLYPGEQLPRWALTGYFRRDGVPIWRNRSMIADLNSDYGFGAQESKLFAQNLAEKLLVSADNVVPAHEDMAYYLWKEGQLPLNVDVTDPRLDDALERERIGQVFSQGLGHIVGYALPLHPTGTPEQPGWISGPLMTRRDKVFLVPGDSAMGYRLPIDTLPWVTSTDYPRIVEQDPFEERKPLPTHAELVQMRMQSPTPLRSDPGGEIGKVEKEKSYRKLTTDSRASQVPSCFESASNAIRTTLCVEVREGRLHIFMPPQPNLESYLKLTAVVEETAEELGMPVMIEGYTPPVDHRLNSFSVTPDPGVLEVNIHPAHSWSEMVNIHEGLAKHTQAAHLGTEKFLADGRHVGTGGGNHITLGGSSPADSPFIRRPDMLKSFVGFWLDHPSLSFLFSGRFIGPTSQAPRIDEARHDSLHELEIAFRELDRQSSPTPPWLVDRLFRHILTDSTGNTHRAEFCIDKLYNPESSAGRQGILEMRSFEMTPHPRMGLLQQLLVRGLISSFWRKPYEASLPRWGTSLHDQFLLPHFVERDFEHVLGFLKEFGFDFKQEWFQAQLEFRFPRIGHVVYDSVELQLRNALEPWHVLGEQGRGGTTARFVDSSVERIEVKIRGAIEGRHGVSCNGYAVPMHKTGVCGEMVAGVRYRSWQPAQCLHPTIAPHGPLVFDLYDTRTKRSLGGCTYHISDPGGQNAEDFPVNSEAAESRRRSRFWDFGHTPGAFDMGPALVDSEFPHTLDLRKVYGNN